MIRAVRSNPTDTDICSQLSFSVVHGLMAGFTGFTVGKINGKTALIPIEFLNEHGVSHITANDRGWQRLLSSTGQPSFLCDTRVLEACDMLIRKKSLDVESQMKMKTGPSEKKLTEKLLENYDSKLKQSFDLAKKKE